MDDSQQQQLMSYLSADEPINHLKQELSFIQNDQDESTKENNFKSVRVVSGSGSAMKLLLDRDTNSQQQSQQSSVMSNVTNTVNQIPSRDVKLQEWLSGKKDVRSPSVSAKKQQQQPPISSMSQQKSINHLASAEKHQGEVFMSQAEIMQKYFNSRIGYGDGKSASSAAGGVIKNTPTKPQSPKFHTSQRQQIHSLRNRLLEEMEEKRNSSMKKKKIDPSTFVLGTDLRARSRGVTPIKSEADIEQECLQLASSFKARAMPEYKEFMLQKSEKKPITFNQFALSTEDRGRQKEQQLKQKLQEEIDAEEKARRFHAHQVPDYNDLAMQFVGRIDSSPKPTLPVGFKFETEKRAAEHLLGNQPIQNQVENNLFKAKRMPDYSKMKSPIAPSPRKTTVPVDPVLSSTNRALERRLFDENFKEKSQAEKEEEERQEAERIERENREYQAIITQNAFKASSVKKYKAVEIHKSELPLTQPESPKFNTTIRATIHQQQQSRE